MQLPAYSGEAPQHIGTPNSLLLVSTNLSHFHFLSISPAINFLLQCLPITWSGCLGHWCRHDRPKDRTSNLWLELLPIFLNLQSNREVTGFRCQSTLALPSHGPLGQLQQPLLSLFCIEYVCASCHLLYKSVIPGNFAICELRQTRLSV